MRSGLGNGTHQCTTAGSPQQYFHHSKYTHTSTSKQDTNAVHHSCAPQLCTNAGHRSCAPLHQSRAPAQDTTTVHHSTNAGHQHREPQLCTTAPTQDTNAGHHSTKGGPHCGPPRRRIAPNGFFILATQVNIHVLYIYGEGVSSQTGDSHSFLVGHGVLPECEVPEAAPDLVAALSNLDPCRVICRT